MKVKVTQSCPTVWTYSQWNSPGQDTGVGSLSLLQEFFPTQGSNPGLPHCRWILYQQSHQWSPRILEWVACPFSSGSSWPRNWTRISCIAGRFFTNWAVREALEKWYQRIYLQGRSGERDREWTYGHGERGGEGDIYGERVIQKLKLPCVK